MILNGPVFTFVLLLTASSIAVVAPVGADEHDKGDIIVEISGAGSNDGKILWRMFANKQTFESPEDGGVTEGECELQDYKCTFVIPEMSFGEYAIMATVRLISYPKLPFSLMVSTRILGNFSSHPGMFF